MDDLRRQRRRFRIALIAFAAWVGALGWMAFGTRRQPPASPGAAPGAEAAP